MIVNRTPHTVVVGDEVFYPVAPPLRVETKEYDANPIAGVHCVRQETGEPNLPEQGIHYYIVSRSVFEAAPKRADLLVPDTGKGAIRDDSGNVIAVTRLIRR